MTYRLEILRDEQDVDRVAPDLGEDQEDVDDRAHDAGHLGPVATRVDEGGPSGVGVVQEHDARTLVASLEIKL